MTLSRRKMNLHKMYVFLWEADDFCFSGPPSAVLREHSWAVLGASWAVSKPPWTVVGLRVGGSSQSRPTLSDCLEEGPPLEAQWPVLAAATAALAATAAAAALAATATDEDDDVLVSCK